MVHILIAALPTTGQKHENISRKCPIIAHFCAFLRIFARWSQTKKAQKGPDFDTVVLLSPHGFTPHQKPVKLVFKAQKGTKKRY